MAAASLFQGAKAEVIIGILDLGSPSPQRSSVFLDEVLEVSVLLHTSCDEDILKESLSRLSITLETHATGGPARPRADKGPQSDTITELINRCDVDVVHDPITAISSSRTTLAWSTQIHIDRTRITSHLPVLAFTATLTLAPSLASQTQPVDTDSSDNEYLVSGVPVASPNLLAALATSPAFANSPNPPHLAESRLHKTPAIRPRSMQPVQQTPTLRTTSPQFKLLPAVMSRLRTVNVGQAPNMAKVLASMEIEVARDVKEAEIEVVTVTLEGGSAVRREVTEESRLPRTMRAGDLLDLVYDMRLDGIAAGDTDDAHSQTTKHRATVFLTAKIFALSNPTRGLNIKSHWRTPIDLSSLSQHQANATAPSTSLLNLVTLTTSRAHNTPATSTPGSTIHWTLVVANRSPTRTLNLAVVPIVPGAHPTAPRPLLSQQATSATGPVHTQKTASTSALPTSLPTWLYTSTAYHNISLPQTTSAATGPALPASTPILLPSTPHIPIGPLPPGTSTTATASFEVLGGWGAGGVEALRVIDLDSLQAEGRWRWGDVIRGWLPEVWVSRQTEEEDNGQVPMDSVGAGVQTQLAMRTQTV